MSKSAHSHFALDSGKIINGYKIDKLLGIGNFGIIYKAEDILLNMPVAIKEYFPTSIARRSDAGEVVCIISNNEQEFEEGKGRFVIEAQIAAKFNHINIVNILRYFHENSTAYLVMRYEPGEELSTLIEKEQFPSISENILLPIFTSVLTGLKTLHDAGCVHRDIKPSNILIRETGEPLLLDFGGAQANDVSGATEVKVVTPYYAPIEQYDSTLESFRPSLDIYALGATLYRCIRGKPPCRSMLRQAAFDAGDKDPYQPLVPQLPDGYPAELLQLIDQMLELHHSNRPQTVDEVLHKLVEFSKEQSEKFYSGAPVLQEALSIISVDQAVSGSFVECLSKIACLSYSSSSDPTDPPQFTINYPGTVPRHWQAAIFTRPFSNPQLLLDGSITEGSIIWLLEADKIDLSQTLSDFFKQFQKLPQTGLNLLIGIISTSQAANWSLATLRQILPPNNSKNTVALMELRPDDSEHAQAFMNSLIALREAKLRLDR
ncbi:MAG: hypothetical protein DRQ54_00570 [Gammaproteobacteria bacterium]|nr:MAG: hypothetical protein DRQ54_00570 [Gammaproteobacteria bacterium]